MRSVMELLEHLRSQGIAISLEKGTLKCSAPKGVLTASLREELAARKPEIIFFLQSSHTGVGVRDAGILPIDRSTPLPLSFSQQRLWFLHQLDPLSPVYNIAAAIRLIGSLDVLALEKTLSAIVTRHESLRTSFVQSEGSVQIRIGDGQGWRLERYEAGPIPDHDQQITVLTAEIARKPFDLTQGPLFRAALLQVEAENYALVLCMHHIIADGWSLGVFVREFTELYTAYAAGRQPSLAPLRIQYPDFAAWQRAWLENGELDRQLPYWKEQLSGAPQVLQLPIDHLRPARESFRGRRSRFAVAQDVVLGLERLSQSSGATLFMTLLAAFKVLLFRYTGQEDIVIGSASANRTRIELNDLIGFFVNNLVLRTKLTGNPTFRELLGRVRETALAAYDHQDVPFNLLVQALRPERSLEHSPLFQVMFTFQNFPFQDLQLPGLTVTPMPIDVDTARFDLNVEVFPKDGALWADFEYNTDLFEAGTIARMQEHYRILLASVAANPDQPISTIPLLPERERWQLLVDWNNTETALGEALSFMGQFEHQVEKTPDRLAVIAGPHALTYRELNEQANRVAHLLLQRGAGPEKLIALFIERSTDLVVGLLAVLKSGAAYVPLDPIYPPHRLAAILDDARPLAVLTVEPLRPRLPATTAEVICLDALPASAEIGPCANPAVAVQPEHLAYVIFTSGSTGKPKGVQITRGGLVNFLESMRKQPGLSPDDVLLAVTTVSFDIAALELLLPLYTGARVCVALQPGNPEVLLDEIERYHPTVMQGTPANWQLLLSAGWQGDPHLKILCGGEALSGDLARQLIPRCQSLWNMYGPTETTIWSAVLRVAQADETAVPVGGPIENTSFYLLDAFQQPVPIGVPGELYIGGLGLARGYLNRPELTAEKFVPNPFSTEPNARLYRTGDAARYRADGTLEFLGRLDHQVKLRGFRIELGEIESTLRRLEAVRDAVVVLREDSGDKQLVGYLATNGHAPSLSAVRERLRETLPEYMIPAAFVCLPDLPRLPNGKLNRAALPAPEASSAQPETSFVCPTSDVQIAVAGVFRELLKVDRVSVLDNFFDLGAHSLLLVQAHQKLKENVDPQLSLVHFFQYPTIAALSEFMSKRQETKSPVASQLVLTN